MKRKEPFLYFNCLTYNSFYVFTQRRFIDTKKVYNDVSFIISTVLRLRFQQNMYKLMFISVCSYREYLLYRSKPTMVIYIEFIIIFIHYKPLTKKTDS